MANKNGRIVNSRPRQRDIEMILVDPVPAFRKGVAVWLENDTRLTILAEVARVEEAMPLARAYQPDILLWGSDAVEFDGAVWIPDVAAASPMTRLVLLSAFDHIPAMPESLKSLSVTMLARSVSRACLIATLQSLVKEIDESALADAAHRNGSDQSAKLSARQRDLFNLIRLGLTNREIAGRLGIREHTVEKYLSALFAKLGVRTRTDLLRNSRFRSVSD